jgi:hypothetical protein
MAVGIGRIRPPSLRGLRRSARGRGQRHEPVCAISGLPRGLRGRTAPTVSSAAPAVRIAPVGGCLLTRRPPSCQGGCWLSRCAGVDCVRSSPLTLSQHFGLLDPGVEQRERLWTVPERREVDIDRGRLPDTSAARGSGGRSIRPSAAARRSARLKWASSSAPQSAMRFTPRPRRPRVVGIRRPFGTVLVVQSSRPQVRWRRASGVTPQLSTAAESDPLTAGGNLTPCGRVSLVAAVRGWPRSRSLSR